ncbi:MAG: bifunctional methylenetetrahydrofolate dehydrogenase/methenyltetrahydrofolate cyclohydrolase FolD [Proteobacteria bacterium]|nr:MAG: bifunctional methylenetetrahydrofolate dehydrogenase/methenyltetrahydrofolate cyclohydrolase FolD [Pseudomonadota bacterium]
MAHIIDGKAFAARLRTNLADGVSRLRGAHGIQPGLAVVLVGEDPASQVYVRNKARQTVEAGMQSFEHRLSDTTSQDELLSLIETLNHDDAVNGILVQLPLPSHIEEAAVINAIDPAKDVDGFHLYNVGLLSTGNPGLVPCTPLGCMMMLKDYLKDLSGARAIVVGRSNIVGKPMASLLLASNCTVTIAHSRTRELADECRRADIVVAAVGRPQMVTGDWIGKGATVIDVGINRVEAPGGKSRLVGDVEFESAEKVAGAITPVPGGVGPMTIACLLRNTVEATCRQQAIDPGEFLPGG